MTFLKKLWQSYKISTFWHRYTDEVTKCASNIASWTTTLFLEAQGLQGPKKTLNAPIARTIVAGKNHTLRVQFSKKKLDLCQKHDKVTQFDSTGTLNKILSHNFFSQDA